MLSKTHTKYIQSLQHKKFRDEYESVYCRRAESSDGFVRTAGNLFVKKFLLWKNG